MRPVPLFGTGIRSVSRGITAQRRLNVYFEIRDDSEISPIIVRGTPGDSVAYQLPTFPIWGWRVVNGVKYVVAGTVLYSVNPGLGVTALGSLPTVSQNVEMTDNGIQIGIVDGVRGYSYTIASGTLAVIGNSFPAGSSSITCLDSFAVAQVPASRFFYVSTVLDLTTSGWATIIKGTKENTSDPLVAVDALNGMLILWGSQSMEFWQDVGASPMPFTRINGASQTWGLAAKSSRALLANTMIFLGQNPQGGVQVLMLQGYTPTRVSTPDVEAIIAGFTVYTDAVSLTYLQNGHSFYQLTFPNAGRSFLFDATTPPGFWSEVQTGVSLQARHKGNLGIAFNTKNYISDATTGNVYQLNATLFTENGAAIKRQVASRHVRDNGNEFSIGEIYLLVDTGDELGKTTHLGRTPQIVLQVSKDSGHTFGPERLASLGNTGQYKYPRARWNRLGSSRDFVFLWTVTDPIDFVIMQGVAQPIPGTEILG